NISLHVMLTRLMRQTSLQVELHMYAELEDDIRDRLRRSLIKINDETESPRWLKEKTGFNGPREYDPAGSCQFNHPICKTLAGYAITYKWEKTRKVRALYV